MDYTKKQKINALCEARQFTGTDAEKLTFLQKVLLPRVSTEITNHKTRIEGQIALLQEELAKLSNTPLQELNKRAIRLLRQAETKALTDNLGEL